MSELLGPLPVPLLLAVVAVLVTAETALVAGLLLPGTGLLLALGFFAHLGIVTTAAAAGTAVAAAMCGGQLAYLFGRRRRDLPSISPIAGMVPEAAWVRLGGLVAGHPGWAVVAGQFLGGARPLAARMAGWSGTPYRVFASAHPPAATVWATGLVLTGQFAGAEVQRMVSGGLTLAGPLLVGGVLLVLWARRLSRGSRPRPAAPTPPAGGEGGSPG